MRRTIARSLMVVICIGLLVYINQVVKSGSNFEVRQTNSEPIKPLTLIERSAPSISDAAIVNNRPVFAEDRKPFSVANKDTTTKKSSAPSARSKFQLIAVINSPGTQIAIIQSKSDSKVSRLRAGESIGEWTLISVTNVSVTVSNGELSEVLELLLTES